MTYYVGSAPWLNTNITGVTLSELANRASIVATGLSA